MLGAALAAAISLLACGALSPGVGLAAKPLVPGPFVGSALWVDRVSPQETTAQLVARAAESGARTLYVKAAEGAAPEPQFSPTLVREIREAGVEVCAWTFARGLSPLAEAAAAVAAVVDGAQCLVVDAEGEYDSRYGPAQVFVRALRARLGAVFPIGLASQAEVSQHPTFPYSVFLGPGGFNVVLPEVYWLDFGVSVEAAYAATVGANSIYGRPILPVGQLYGSPATAELVRFRALANAYGVAGSSFFDLDSAGPEQLATLRAPAPAIHPRAIVAPTIRAGADGDQIVRAQELLNSAGAHLPVGGFFGAETARAVAAFQARHHLRASGVLGPATWRALLRFHAREPSWAGGPPDSAQ
jgi:hypothetical protein